MEGQFVTDQFSSSATFVEVPRTDGKNWQTARFSVHALQKKGVAPGTVFIAGGMPRISIGPRHDFPARHTKRVAEKMINGGRQ